MTFDPGIRNKFFDQSAFDFYKKFPKTVAVFSLSIPLNILLLVALEEHIIHIALDYDRNESRSPGFVYRIAGRDASIDFPNFPNDSIRPLRVISDTVFKVGYSQDEIDSLISRANYAP